MGSYALPSYSLVAPQSVLFYVGRHASTENNEDDLFRGAENPNLSDQGREEAQKQADFLRQFKIGKIFSSTYNRAMQTAEIVAKSRGKEIIELPALKSWNIGVASGQPEESAAEDMVDYFVHHPDETIPQGESLNAFKARVIPALEMAERVGREDGVPPFLEAHNSVIHEVSLRYNGNMNDSLIRPAGVVAVHTKRSGGLTATAIFRIEDLE